MGKDHGMQSVLATENYLHASKCLKFGFVIDYFTVSKSKQDAYKYHEDSLQILIMNNRKHRQTQTENKTSK